MPIDANTRAHASAIAQRNRTATFARLRAHAGMLALSAAAGALAMGWFEVPVRDLGYAASYAQTRFEAWIFADQPVDPQIAITIDGVPYRWGAKEWAGWAPLVATASEVEGKLAKGAGGGLALGLAGLALGAALRRRKRDALLADRVLAGTRVASAKQLARLTRKAGADRQGLAIGPVLLPPGLETRHAAMIATTGAGKTTALRQLLDKIEAQGHTALVWDTSGEFIAHYYNAARGDVILNPFDERGAYWNPFSEIAHPADADRIARHLVPDGGSHDGHDVWIETARTLVANMLRVLWQAGRGTPETLLDALQTMPRAEIEQMVAGTASARSFEADADKATASVLFMLARAASLIAFLRASPGNGAKAGTGTEAGFSFRRFFVEHDRAPGNKPWIFVPRREEYFEAMKPLLALWLECAASAMLSQAPSARRRVWFVLDELADLPKVENLARLLPEGRKFGAAVVLTFQAIGQMHHRYSRDRAEAMLAQCNTKLLMQMPDHDTRTWASDQIGSQLVEIQTLADAIDPKTGALTRTLSTTRTTRPAVLESDLRLPPYTGYLLLPDGMPVARIKLGDAHIRARGAERHPRFVPVDIGETLWGRLSGETSAAARGGAGDAPLPDPPSQGPV